MFKPALIILEGNISAGKTSLSKELGKLLDYHVFLEPTVTNPYLEQYYTNPVKYALIMQIWLLKQRFRTYISALKFTMEKGKGVILDRSIFSDWVFAEKNRRDKNISEEGYAEYLRIRKELLAHLPSPQVTIYLDVSPEECHRRVHIRKRDCESGIPLDYLSGLDECYRSFLGMMRSIGSTVVEVPWNSFGSSASVSQLVSRALDQSSSLESALDVEELSRYVTENPLVQSVLNEEECSPETATRAESEFLAEEIKNRAEIDVAKKPSPQPPSSPNTSSSGIQIGDRSILRESPIKQKQNGIKMTVSAN